MANTPFGRSDNKNSPTTAAGSDHATYGRTEPEADTSFQDAFTDKLDFTFWEGVDYYTSPFTDKVTFLREEILPNKSTEQILDAIEAGASAAGVSEAANVIAKLKDSANEALAGNFVKAMIKDDGTISGLEKLITADGAGENMKLLEEALNNPKTSEYLSTQFALIVDEQREFSDLMEEFGIDTEATSPAASPQSENAGAPTHPNDTSTQTGVFNDAADNTVVGTTFHPARFLAELDMPLLERGRINSLGEDATVVVNGKQVNAQIQATMEFIASDAVNAEKLTSAIAKTVPATASIMEKIGEHPELQQAFYNAVSKDPTMLDNLPTLLGDGTEGALNITDLELLLGNADPKVVDATVLRFTDLLNEIADNEDLNFNHLLDTVDQLKQFMGKDGTIDPMMFLEMMKNDPDELVRMMLAGSDLAGTPAGQMLAGFLSDILPIVAEALNPNGFMLGPYVDFGTKYAAKYQREGARIFGVDTGVVNRANVTEPRNEDQEKSMAHGQYGANLAMIKKGDIQPGLRAGTGSDRPRPGRHDDSPYLTPDEKDLAREIEHLDRTDADAVNDAYIHAQQEGKVFGNPTHRLSGDALHDEQNRILDLVERDLEKKALGYEPAQPSDVPIFAQSVRNLFPGDFGGRASSGTTASRAGFDDVKHDHRKMIDAGIMPVDRSLARDPEKLTAAVRGMQKEIIQEVGDFDKLEGAELASARRRFEDSGIIDNPIDLSNTAPGDLDSLSRLRMKQAIADMNKNGTPAGPKGGITKAEATKSFNSSVGDGNFDRMRRELEQGGWTITKQEPSAHDMN